jgi:DNA-binding CsgD family transcriptional regulator/tetratricopeptide (TPR) repeat protein
MQLLERTSFLRTLAEYAAEASRGDGRLVLVSGESGLGKTALLDAFQREQPEPRWLWGACDGLFTPRPLGPLFDIGAQADGAAGELAGLCRRGAERDRLFDALLAELDAPAPLTIVVIEDVHWADEATIDLLSFVGRRLARRAALILVTYRDDELGDDHPLRRALGDLATQRTTRRMRLVPLSQDALRTLAGGREVNIAELHRITGGNPFYVSEILDAGWPSIPPTVRDAVGARMARLTPDARAAAELTAVMSARLPSSVLSTAVAASDAAVTECLASGLLVPDGSGLRFRHELARMAVEAGIAPHRKAELHTRLLAALESDNGADPALLAHHAEGSGDRPAVLRHAPVAARRASALGAHRESAAQFERAIRFAEDLEPGDLAALHEGIAAEYSLQDRWEEAEVARRAALRLRRQLGDNRKVGENLQLLSTTLWRLCRGDESYHAAEEALQVMRSGPASREQGWAYAGLGIAQLERGQLDDGIELIERGRVVGEQLDLPDLVSFTLNALGLGLAKANGIEGVRHLERALRIGLDAELPEAAGRAYSSLEEMFVSLQQFDQSERYYTDGMAFCDGRELGVFSLCLRGWRTVALVQLGRWPEAADMCADLLSRRGISPVNRLNPLRGLGAIKGRRNDPAGWDLLDEAAALGEATTEPQWIVPVRAVRAELRWLSGDNELAAAEAQSGYQAGLGRVDDWTLGSVAIWLARLRGPAGLAENLPEPYALEIAGHAERAAQVWDKIGRPYDAAMARLQSSEEDSLRQAFCALDNLGAEAAVARARRRMRELGIGNIPRGPRPGTRSAPGGLTAREQEVLALLTEGLQDREISARLVISERTVHHHVSAILAKIGVTSRAAAVRAAARMGTGTPT